MATKRLKIECKNLIKTPIEHIVALPRPSNILEWHFLLSPADDTLYGGGKTELNIKLTLHCTCCVINADMLVLYCIVLMF